LRARIRAHDQGDDTDDGAQPHTTQSWVRAMDLGHSLSVECRFRTAQGPSPVRPEYTAAEARMPIRFAA
jgi:hypothetical protein